MGDGINRLTLVGNIGTDPELKILRGSGQAKLTFRLATTEAYLDRQNVRQERTDWHQIELWGKRAEALAKILEKGVRIYLEGPMRYSSWVPELTIALDDQGRCPHCAQHPRRTSAVVSATDLVLLTKRRPGGQGPPARDPDDPGPAPPDGDPLF